MHNFFNANKLKSFKEQQELKSLSITEKQEAYKQRTLQMAAHSLSQLESLIDIHSPVPSQRMGTIPVIHPSQNPFRDRNKEFEKSPNDLIMRNYLPANERATQAQDDYIQSHLEKEAFNPNEPHKKPNFRLRDPKNELEPMRFHQERCEMDRVNKSIAEISQLIDHSERDLRMKINPSWKDLQKDKWLSNKDFNASQTKIDCPWDKIPYRSPQSAVEKYVDGLEAMGSISRKRLPQLEENRPVFNAAICKDPQGSALMRSQSIRTFKQDQQLGILNHDQYSKNHKLRYYKQGLVKTQSVDHLAPYNHSNNFQALKDLRPSRYQKQLYKSIDHYGPRIFQQQPTKTDSLHMSQKSLKQISQQHSQPQIGQQLAKIQEDLQNTNTNFNEQKTGKSKLIFFQNHKDNSTQEFKDQSNSIFYRYPYYQLDNDETKKIIAKYFNQ